MLSIFLIVMMYRVFQYIQLVRWEFMWSTNQHEYSRLSLIIFHVIEAFVWSGWSHNLTNQITSSLLSLDFFFLIWKVLYMIAPSAVKRMLLLAVVIAVATSIAQEKLGVEACIIIGGSIFSPISTISVN